ncbi:MAG: hypothetical protein JXP34_20735 [Planctomycetes bacterium]|nr:hypothetical protein [Planctomycetota bacterium]
MIRYAAIAAAIAAIAGCSSEEARLSRVQSNYYERLKESQRAVEMERTRYEGLRTEVMAADRDRQLEMTGLRAERDGLRRAIEEILREIQEAREPGPALRRVAGIATRAQEEADRMRSATERRRATAVAP